MLHNGETCQCQVLKCLILPRTQRYSVYFSRGPKKLTKITFEKNQNEMRESGHFP